MFYCIELSPSHNRRSAFTLIELLIVIAIIAILSVVVVLTLNPAGLLQQSRDANRISDMETLNTSLGIYSEDVGTSFGSASTTYIDIADPTATSTAGDQCQGLGLPSLPTGLSYHCPASSTLRSSNGTGWLPVALSSISIGTPLSVLPIDPTNSTSSNLYYSYNTNGSQYQLNAHFESAKYLPSEAASGGYDPAVYNTGNNLNIAPWTDGMVGYWPLNEGSGSSTLDKSGLGNNGTWNGTATGTAGTYYSTGNNQAYAGDFDGSTDYVQVPTISVTSTISVSAWVYSNNFVQNGMIVEKDPVNTQWELLFEGAAGLKWRGGSGTQIICSPPNNSTWNQVVAIQVGTTATIYMNGALCVTGTVTAIANSSSTINIGRYTNGYYYAGLIDDVRIYSRALSASEIAAIYAAGK